VFTDEHGTGLVTQTVTAQDALEPLSAEWDALAAACDRPQMAPAFVLAWWRRVASPDAQPRLVTVRERGRLVGIAPFYVEPTARRARIDYRLPGIELCGGMAPLAVHGRETEVATSVGAALADATPRPHLIALEGLPTASPWAAALRDSWPGARRPTLRQYQVHGCPIVTLKEPSFDAWLADKSTNFRSQMRRLRRHFTAAGGTSRLSTEATLERDVWAFVHLHEQRWDGRGYSNLVQLGERLPAFLQDLGEALLPSERFRLRMLELDGEAISAQVFLAAGDTVLYVNGGWDERHARLKPSMLGLLDTVETTFSQNERRIDLGAGEQAYKLRFADDNDPIGWSILVPPGHRRLITRAHTAPMLTRYALRDAAKRALSDEQTAKLRTLRARLSP
jgi:CelD/BcsL family acetyltransferase involved in cellulose biosynthesis